MEIIQKKEYNEHSQGHLFSFQRIQKQWSLAKLGKITFILFECHRSIDKSIDFHFLLLLWKVSLWQRAQSWKFEILLWIPNQSLLSQTLNITNFHLSTFPAKINDKIFKVNKKNPFFVVILAQREFFLKATLVKYNCSGAKYYYITISMQKLFNQSAKFIKSFVR